MTEQLKDKKDLLKRAGVLYKEILVLEQDLDELAAEFTFDKEDNKLGLPKATVKTVLKVAEVDAANSFEKLIDKRLAQEEFEEEFKELTGYDA